MCRATVTDFPTHFHKQTKCIHQPHLLRTFTPNIQQRRIANQHPQTPRSEIGLQKSQRVTTLADKSAIEWTEATWNPVTACDKVSPGCAHCYAETFAER